VHDRAIDHRTAASKVFDEDTVSIGPDFAVDVGHGGMIHAYIAGFSASDNERFLGYRPGLRHAMCNEKVHAIPPPMIDAPRV
jgi:hypothetical protein